MSPLRAIEDCIQPVPQISTRRRDPEDRFTYIDLSSIDKNEKRIDKSAVQNLVWREAPSRARQIVRTGDVLVSTVRPNLNGVAQVDDELDQAIASTGFCVLRAEPTVIDPRYLFHWVSSPRFVAEMVRLSTGASYPAVSDRVVHSSLAPIPKDLSEQRRIATNLDKVGAIRAKRREAFKCADSFLAALFLDTFGDPLSNRREWNESTLRTVTNKIGSGATPLGGESVYRSAGVTFIRSMNVHDQSFVEEDLAYLDDEQASRLANVEVLAGDLLLNITGASVARSCLVPKTFLPARVNQHVCIIRPNEKLVPEFLEAQMLCESTKRRLLQIGESMGATRQAITKSQLESFTVVVPPKQKQEKYAKVVRAVREQKARMHSFENEESKFLYSLQRTFFG